MVWSAQTCLILCDHWTIALQVLLSMGFSWQGKNTGVGCHVLLQGSSQVRDQTRISCIGRHILYHRGTWEAPVEYYSTVKKNRCYSMEESWKPYAM